MAFIHDINALALLKKNLFPVIIILINNNGGGIFNFLPISKYDDIFSEYFLTPHTFHFRGVAETFKISYGLAKTIDEFKALLRKAELIASKKGKSFIIEAQTNSAADFSLRRKIKKEIIEMLET